MKPSGESHHADLTNQVYLPLILFSGRPSDFSNIETVENLDA